MNNKQFPKKAVALGLALASAGSVCAEELLTLEEIVVTAQKREQSLQDVPVAVTAFDAESLRASGVTDVNTLTQASPSFSIAPGQNKVSSSPMRIRGIGTVGTNPAFEGAVGLYVDGVYRSRPGMVMATFNDISHLEVLRGPQGTLFGKNTSAGALQLRSATPSQEFEAGVDIELGNYDKRKVSAMVNGAITDELSMRFSVMTEQADGIFDNLTTGDDIRDTDTQSYKLQGLYEADNYTLRVIADYNTSEEACCYARTSINADETATQANPALAGLYALQGAWVKAAGNQWHDDVTDTYSYDILNNTTPKDETTDWGISVDLSTDLSDTLSLRSITAYREYENESTNADWDFSSLELSGAYNQFYEFETFSQEFNLTGNFEFAEIETDYVLGVFYSKETMDHTLAQGSGNHLWKLFAAGAALDYDDPANMDLARPGTLFQHVNFEQDNEVKAVFAHLTFALSENINLITGLRYSEETKEVDRTNLIADNDADMLAYMLTNQKGLLGLGASYTGPNRSFEVSDEEWTYSASLQYFLNSDTQLYASYSRGFKAGGVDLNGDAGGGLLAGPNATLSSGTYAPEIVDSYELGIKTEYLDGRGRLNMSAFMSDYTDVQAAAFTGTAFVTYNAPELNIHGLELENTFLIAEGLTSNISLTHMGEASFSDDSNPLQPGLEGREISHAPEWSAVVGLAYETELSNQWGLFSNFNFAYQSPHYVSNSVELEEEYATVQARIGMRTLDNRLEVSLSCANCTDEEYLYGANDYPFQQTGHLMGQIGMPRTYSANIRYSFGE